MDVHVLVHLDRSTAEPVWWAESPDVPGLTIAAPDLQELLTRTTAAISEILEERDEVVSAVNFELAEADDENANPVGGMPEPMAYTDAGGIGVRQVSVLSESAA